MGYEYDFVSKVPDEYVCSICDLPMRKPVQTRCGHRFCKDCLDESNKRKRVAECPMDRQPINVTKEKLFEDKAVERAIFSLIIKCANEGSGCQWQGELGNLEDHKPRCNYRLIKCTNECCDVEKPVIEMHLHEQEECEWRNVTCYCKQTMISKRFEEHKVHCKEVPVECPNQCGQKIKKREVEDHIDSHCQKSVVTCSYFKLGCEFEGPRENINDHIEHELRGHLSLLFKQIMQLQEKMNKSEASTEQTFRSLKNEHRELNKDFKQSFRSLKNEHRELNKDFEQSFRGLEKEHGRLYDHVEENFLNLTITMSENTEKIKSVVRGMKLHVWDILFSLVIVVIVVFALTSYQIAGPKTECSELKHGLKRVNEKLTTKVMWIVKNNDENSLYKDFYTDRTGYKLRITLYPPNIKKNKENNHFSLTVAILRGEYDAILDWPFSKIIKVTLLDQNENTSERKNINVVIDPKEYHGSSYIKRPAAIAEPAFAFTSLMSMEHFTANLKNYVFEDSLFLLVEIE